MPQSGIGGNAPALSYLVNTGGTSTPSSFWYLGVCGRSAIAVLLNPESLSPVRLVMKKIVDEANAWLGAGFGAMSVFTAMQA
jgi:hypothetical protein